MNLRWVHALLILFSAALAVLFGVWCLNLYGREDGTATLVAAIASFAVSFGLVDLRLVVPSEDKDTAMKGKSIRLGMTRVLTTAAAVLDRRQFERFRLSRVLRGGGDLDDRRGEAWRPGDAGRTVSVQGAFAGFFLYLRQRAKRIAEIDLDTEWSELQGGASRT